MKNESPRRPRECWAHFRHAVVAPLLVMPPGKGELQERLRELAARDYTHPVTGAPVRFGVSSIERWYYLARDAKDPVGALTRRRRKDAGRMKLSSLASSGLRQLYQEHPSWHKYLLWQNLASVLKKEPGGEDLLPSYSTVRRYLLAHGLHRSEKDRNRHRPGYQRARLRKEQQETRSYDLDDAGALWHADFHGGSLSVLLPSGKWIHPEIFACIDDCSRLICHAQWYLVENSENVAHGLSQAIQKRGMPVSFMSDRGKAFLAGETTGGLRRLGILHEPTLEYSPHQNGKMESWWGVIENQLLAMLEGVENLTLELLNRATQAFVELQYHRTVHSEIKMSPIEKYRQVKDLSRASPSSESLRVAFTREVTRKQRRGDGTIRLAGQRYEIPSRYRHIQKMALRYAEWDLSRVHLADLETGDILCPIFPLDKSANADGRRRRMSPAQADASEAKSQASPERKSIAPLMTDLLNEYASRGTPPAYLPRPEEKGEKE